MPTHPPGPGTPLLLFPNLVDVDAKGSRSARDPLSATDALGSSYAPGPGVRMYVGALRHCIGSTDLGTLDPKVWCSFGGGGGSEMAADGAGRE